MDATPQPQPPQEPSPKADGLCRGGTGKIARLSLETRDKVGLMILDGYPFPEIVQALGEAGVGITPKNISNWKAATFHQWQIEFNRRQSLNATRQAALDMLQDKPAIPVQDAGRTIAAAQLYELLLAFDPTSFAAALADKPELYIRLVNAVSRLSEGEAACGHHRTQDSLIRSKLADAEAKPDKKLLAQGELKQLAHEIKII
jgi:hypothetical protein